jgi:hypothetical protein
MHCYPQSNVCVECVIFGEGGKTAEAYEDQARHVARPKAMHLD